jgi:hypothetical protein
LSQEIDSRELTCLSALRSARRRFFCDIVDHASDYSKKQLSKNDVDLLRGDTTYQVAEFYYVIDDMKLADKQKMRLVLERHNRDMEELVANRQRRELMGLLKQSVERAIFSPIQIDKVVENVVDGKLRLDQSDLGRLLAQAMSPETCRKVVVSLARGGLINRINIGQVLIVSNGVLEGYFRNHLTSVVKQLAVNSRHADAAA